MDIKKYVLVKLNGSDDNTLVIIQCTSGPFLSTPDGKWYCYTGRIVDQNNKQYEFSNFYFWDYTVHDTDNNLKDLLLRNLIFLL